MKMSKKVSEFIKANRLPEEKINEDDWTVERMAKELNCSRHTAIKKMEEAVAAGTWGKHEKKAENGRPIKVYFPIEDDKSD